MIENEITTEAPKTTTPAAKPATATPTPSPAVDVNSVNVSLVRATGLRKVRGELKTVELPHYRVMIGDQLAAVTSINPNKPVCAVAEILDYEEGPIIAAVKATRGDTESIKINRPPVVTAAK
ncbi:MAG: hypothetical protein ACO1RT_03435 [Planctomycetaceae bacterium]